MNTVKRENCQIRGILLLRNPIDAAVLSNKAQESIELETFKETSVSKFCHLPLALLNSVNGNLKGISNNIINL